MDTECEDLMVSLASHKDEIKKIVNQLVKNEISIELFDECLAQIVTSLQTAFSVWEARSKTVEK